MIIYVSNLNFTVSNEQLSNIFAPFGQVKSARVVTDKFTSRSRGFGFVEMNDEAAAEQAITKLNGSSVDDRTLNVNKARPKKEL